MIIARAVGLNDCVIEGRNGTTFTGDLSCDALVNLRGEARIYQNRQLLLAQHVDKAGGDDHAVRVNGAGALRVAQISDTGDFAAANADVA